MLSIKLVMKKITLHYVTSARLPTERAHGTQIVKTCEAFARAGAEVTLVKPRKTYIHEEVNIFSYYTVDQLFKTLDISATDFLGATYRFGRFLYWIDTITFIFSLTLRLQLRTGDVLYTRDPILVLPFSKSKYNLCVELHELPRLNFFVRKSLKKASYIVVLNSILKKELIALGFDEHKICVAGDAVDLREFAISDDVIEARRKVSLPKDPPIALYAGHLYGWKGADIFAEASRLIPQVQCVCVGGVEPEFSVFRNRFKDISNLEILPFQKRTIIPFFLKSASVLVLPNSRTEAISAKYTSPLKLFEYMASKRPIVSSDLPSLREVLNDSNAYFFEPDDSKSLARVIALAIQNNNEAEKKAHQAYQDVALHTWDARARNILNFIQS